MDLCCIHNHDGAGGGNTLNPSKTLTEDSLKRDGYSDVSAVIDIVTKGDGIFPSHQCLRQLTASRQAAHACLWDQVEEARVGSGRDRSSLELRARASQEWVEAVRQPYSLDEACYRLVSSLLAFPLLSELVKASQPRSSCRQLQLNSSMQANIYPLFLPSSFSKTTGTGASLPRPSLPPPIVSTLKHRTLSQCASWHSRAAASDSQPAVTQRPSDSNCSNFDPADHPPIVGGNRRRAGPPGRPAGGPGLPGRTVTQ